MTVSLQARAAGGWAVDAGGDAVEAGGACEFDADDEFIAVAGAGADVAGAGEAEVVGAHLDGDGVSGGFGEGEADAGIGDIDGGGLETLGVAAGIEPGDLDGGGQGNAVVAATPEIRHTYVSAGAGGIFRRYKNPAQRPKRRCVPEPSHGTQRTICRSFYGAPGVIRTPGLLVRSA